MSRQSGRCGGAREPRRLRHVDGKEELSILSWTLVFLVVAVIAAVFGFGGIAASAAGIAQILFFIFLVLFVVSLVMGATRRGL